MHVHFDKMQGAPRDPPPRAGLIARAMRDIASARGNAAGSIMGLPVSLRAEILRWAALLLDGGPVSTRGPGLLRLLGEFGVVSETLRRRHYRFEPARRPRPVMLLPGFLTHPRRMEYMRRSLEEAGHRTHDWSLGINLGPTEENFAALRRRVRDLCGRHGEPIALVGWSLGGLFAREVARAEPGAVALVITMGTPFSGDLRANNAWRAYQAVAGHRVEEAPVCADPATRPPVPTVALWSARDGIVAPRSARGRPGERDRAVAVKCTHLGFAYSGEAVAKVLRQLDVME